MKKGGCQAPFLVLNQSPVQVVPSWGIRKPITTTGGALSYDPFCRSGEGRIRCPRASMHRPYWEGKAHGNQAERIRWWP
jgi:hypothetical protein